MARGKYLFGREVHRLPAGATLTELLHRPCATGASFCKSGNRMCSLLVRSGCGNGLVVLYRLKRFGQSCLGFCGSHLVYAALSQPVAVTILWSYGTLAAPGQNLEVGRPRVPLPPSNVPEGIPLETLAHADGSRDTSKWNSRLYGAMRG